MEENHKAEFEKLSMSIGRYRPELATKLRLYSRIETRRYFRDRAIPRNALGLPNEVHLVGMPPEATEAVERYGAKLAKASHYKFSNVIVPATAKIDCRVYTNAELLTGNQQWLEGLAILRLPAEVVRAGKPLDQRFNYRYAITPEGDASAFLISLGDACVIVTRVLLSVPPPLRPLLRCRECSREATNLSQLGAFLALQGA